MKKLVDRQGVEVRLGRVIAQGGEGAVYEIEGRPGFVAKLYHKRPDEDKVANLQNAYGYYVDKKLSREIAALFADDASTNSTSAYEIATSACANPST